MDDAACSETILANTLILLSTMPYRLIMTILQVAKTKTKYGIYNFSLTLYLVNTGKTTVVQLLRLSNRKRKN